MKTDGRLLLGIDIGTTNIKTIAFDPTGNVVAQANMPTPTHYRATGWVYYDPDEIWQQVIGLIRDIVAQLDEPSRITSIGVASYGETGVPIDEHGEPTYEAIAWFDSRTVPQAQWLESTIGLEPLFAVTGVALQPILGLCKLLWLRDNEPAAFARSRVWLNMADYITYRLCGVPATDYSLASRMSCMDLIGQQWATDLLTQIGINPTILPPLLPGGTLLGPLRLAVATTTGLSPATQVAVGGHDHVCGALALGVTRPGDLLNSIGTSEALFIPITQPILDPAYGRQGYTQGIHLAGDYYSFGGLYTSGAAVDWFRHNFAAAATYASLIGEAEQVVAGSQGAFFLPHLRQSSPPHLDLTARGAFIGLAAEMERGVLFRALIEGLAYEMRYSLEPLLHHSGFTQPGTIFVSGGGAHNTLYNTVKASVLNHALTVVDVKETTALGAAVLGGLGAGVYRNLAAALQQIRYTQTIVKPVAADATRYAQSYQTVYRKLYEVLAPLHHAGQTPA
ncbi:MAG: FGGY family carbohydrate kinase [Caldilineaceae bacterium]